MAIIDHVRWGALDRLVVAQQRNRSAHSPVISLFRWWARRPHCFAGALLDAARQEFRLESFLVADPFSGGGTVAFEAARRRLPIYAQDIYPWPSQGLATALTPADPDEFRVTGKALLSKLAPQGLFYKRERAGEVWETTHIIRVRSCLCSQCSYPVFLFREPLVSLASRSANEQRGYFGCSGCGSVTLRRKATSSFRCESCAGLIKTQVKRSPVRTAEFECPHCREPVALSELLRSAPRWHAVLIREQHASRNDLSQLRPIQAGDPIEDFAYEAHPLHRPIPDGLETSALLRYGFSHWDELYTGQQLRIISGALEALCELDASESVKQHLRLAVLGATEMAGYVCRWERYNPKAIEAIANHRFSRSTVTVETNLLSRSGRGTLPRRFEAAEKALRFMRTEGCPKRIAHTHSSARRRLVSSALIVTGSSERQLLKTGSADFVFTDPPYHDDLQYGELSRLFHAWMECAGKVSTADECHEAVANSLRGATSSHYEDKVAACLSESRRTLSPRGRLILTFHNKDLHAWQALANALRRAKFEIVALATVAAENAADHSKRGKESFLSDLVIECRPRQSRKRRPWKLTIQGAATHPERKNLEAIGLALTEYVNRGKGEIEVLFDSHMKRLKARKRLIHRGGG